MIRSRVVVHGYVQGVFFRDTVRRHAVSAGVCGWVRNNREGTVEAVFEGDSTRWTPRIDLSQGPARRAGRPCRRVRGGARGVTGFAIR